MHPTANSAAFIRKACVVIRLCTPPISSVVRSGTLTTSHGENYRGEVKARDIIKLIEKDGWFWVRTKGSHHQYKHQTKPGLVTVPGNPGDDVAVGTLNNILKQAGLKP